MGKNVYFKIILFSVFMKSLLQLFMYYEYK